MFCNSGNLPSPVDTPQSHFKSRAEGERSDVGSLWVVLVPHVVQRRKLFGTVMSKKWGGFVSQQCCCEWTEIWWCLLHLSVCSKQTWLQMCLEVVSSCSELLSFFILGHTFLSTLSFEPTHALFDGMGCNWLFFLILYQLSYTALFRLVTEMSLQSGWSINSIILSVFSLCCFVSSAVSVKTDRNRILLTEQHTVQWVSLH